MLESEPSPNIGPPVSAGDDDDLSRLQKVDDFPEQTADMLRLGGPEFRARAGAGAVPAERVDVPPGMVAVPRVAVGFEDPHEPLRQAPERRATPIAPTEHLVHRLRSGAR